MVAFPVSSSARATRTSTGSSEARSTQTSRPGAGEGSRDRSASGRTVPTDIEAELFTSDLKRTAQTAEAIATTLDLHDLRKNSYGIAAGRPQQ